MWLLVVGVVTLFRSFFVAESASFLMEGAKGMIQVEMACWT